MFNLIIQQQVSLERLQQCAVVLSLRLSLFHPCHHSSLFHGVDLPTLSSQCQFKQLIISQKIYQTHMCLSTSPQPHSSSLPTSWNLLHNSSLTLLIVHSLCHLQNHSTSFATSSIFYHSHVGPMQIHFLFKTDMIPLVMS